MKNNATINGLVDGFSVLEKNNNTEPAYQTDILYNDKEPFDLDLRGIYYDEGYTVSEYRIEDFGQPITLLSTAKEEDSFVNFSDIISTN